MSVPLLLITYKHYTSHAFLAVRYNKQTNKTNTFSKTNALDNQKEPYFGYKLLLLLYIVVVIMFFSLLFLQFVNVHAIHVSTSQQLDQRWWNSWAHQPPDTTWRRGQSSHIWATRRWCRNVQLPHNVLGNHHHYHCCQTKRRRERTCRWRYSRFLFQFHIYLFIQVLFRIEGMYIQLKKKKSAFQVRPIYTALPTGLASIITPSDLPMSYSFTSGWRVEHVD